MADDLLPTSGGTYHRNGDSLVCVQRTEQPCAVTDATPAPPPLAPATSVVVTDLAPAPTSTEET